MTFTNFWRIFAKGSVSDALSGCHLIPMVSCCSKRVSSSEIVVFKPAPVSAGHSLFLMYLVRVARHQLPEKRCRLILRGSKVSVCTSMSMSDFLRFTLGTYGLNRPLGYSALLSEFAIPNSTWPVLLVEVSLLPLLWVPMMSIVK